MPKLVILIRCYNIISILDDCVYSFFVCTERLGRWPDNNERCLKLFKKCCNYVEEGRQELIIHGSISEVESMPGIVSQHEGGVYDAIF